MAENRLISILTRSHFKPKSSTSLHFSMKSDKFLCKSEMYCLSSRREKLNFLKPGPFCCLNLHSRDVIVLQNGQSLVRTNRMSLLIVVRLSCFETRK